MKNATEVQLEHAEDVIKRLAMIAGVLAERNDDKKAMDIILEVLEKYNELKDRYEKLS